MGDWRGLEGRRRAWGLVLAAMVVCLLAAVPAGASGPATTFTVSGFEDGNGSCSASSATTSVCPTLRAAVTAASTQSGSTIELGSGTYQLTLGQLPIGALTIQGSGPGGAGGTTIQQSDGKSRVLEVQAGPATLTDLEITGGNLAPQSWTSCSTEAWVGGGIDAQAPLVLQGVRVIDNQVIAPSAPNAGSTGGCAHGGGVAYTASAAGQSVISDSTIANNSAIGGGGGSGGAPGGGAAGGGIFNGGGHSLLIQRSTVTQNHATGGVGGPGASSGGSGGAGDGGGLFNAGDLTVSGTTISSNQANGGAQGTGGPTPSPTSAGGAGLGGGVFNHDGSEQVVDSTIFGNSAVGGAAATGGTAGSGGGGGFHDQGAGAAATLQSDTIDANGSSSGGGNISAPAGTPDPAIRDTIVAAGSPSNCDLATLGSSESYNLEDDPGGQCGFVTANHDLLGANPQLAPAPADNGGPTQTLAPATTSPVLGAGGQCVDPTSSPANQPLATDQRGEPRANACDIGAFEAQAPVRAVAPDIAGRAVRGQTLMCSEGTWTGDGPFDLAFQWLRNGAPIPGAATNTYVVGPADPGQSLACRVTATHYGSTAATTSFVIVRSYPVITLLKVATNPSITISLGCRGPDGTRCAGMLALTSVERKRAGRVIAVLAGARATRLSRVTVGQVDYSVRARRTLTLRVVPKRNFSRLLQRFRRLPMTLQLTQTTAAGTATVVSRELMLRAAHRRAPRRG